MDYPERTVAVLNSGNTVIVVDDHCYSIMNKMADRWGFSFWIFREALEILKTLPSNPDEAKYIQNGEHID